jgi:hypothetical protein
MQSTDIAGHFNHAEHRDTKKRKATLSQIREESGRAPPGHYRQELAQRRKVVEDFGKRKSRKKLRLHAELKTRL